jgi:hypothetical protein
MITIVKTKDKQLFQEGMRVAFYDDLDLKKYHIKPSDNYEDMVKDSYFNIGIVKGELGAELYVVYFKGILIGFSCIVPKLSMLYSFGININYRKKEILRDWINGIQDIIYSYSGHMNVLLYSKNTRAISFFKKNCFGIIFQNTKIMDSAPATMLVKYKFVNAYKMVDELEFEEGLG